MDPDSTGKVCILFLCRRQQAERHFKDKTQNAPLHWVHGNFYGLSWTLHTEINAYGSIG
jgi:hypothetical protein